MTDHATFEHISRRALGGLAAAGLALPALSACGDDGGGDSSSKSKDLGSTSAIEVGGGAVFADQGVVVTQPTEGDFKAFDATCTHQGCTVGSVAEGTINCPCHGSKFSIEDGSRRAGPANAPLGEVSIKVEGDKILLA